MDKRYQVFISSTYADLKDERAKVMQSIMEQDCIPAGMEIFPAIDQEQFEFIKKVIDDCDYYIIIIGGRYGTLSEDGISYTEKEFDYAIERGIKVIAFIHADPDSLPYDKSEKDLSLHKKLELFKEKVKSNRLIKFWKNSDELAGIVSLSLIKTIKTYPAKGWIRGDSITNPELLKELNEVRKENQSLKEQLSLQPMSIYEGQGSEDLAGLDDEFFLSGTYDASFVDIHHWEVTMKWKDIFSIISPYLLIPQFDETFRKEMAKQLFKKTGLPGGDITIEDESYQTIKIHLRTLGLVELTSKTYTNGVKMIWSLTQEGNNVMIKSKGAKKLKNVG